MRDFRPSAHFMQAIQVVGGPRLEAVINRAAQAGRPPQGYAGTQVTCKVRTSSLLQPGMLTQLEGGDHFLVGRGDQISPSYRVHWLLQADRRVSWTRMATTLDPLTKQPRATAPQDLGEIWVMWGIINKVPYDLVVRIDSPENTVLTASPVQLNDKLDGKTVKNVQVGLGLHVCTVQ